MMNSFHFFISHFSTCFRPLFFSFIPIQLIQFPFSSSQPKRKMIPCRVTSQWNLLSASENENISRQGHKKQNNTKSKQKRRIKTNKKINNDCNTIKHISTISTRNGKQKRRTVPTYQYAFTPIRRQKWMWLELEGAFLFSLFCSFLRMDSVCFLLTAFWIETNKRTSAQ